MGITRETAGKKATGGPQTSSDPATKKSSRTPCKTPAARTPGVFSSFRSKKPMATGADATSKKTKTRPTATTDKKASTCLSTKGKKKDVTVRRKSKLHPMKCFANGEMIEGVNQYKVSHQIRKSTKQLDVDVYAIKDTEQQEEYRMMVAREELQMLKIEAALLRKLEKVQGNKQFVSMAEYGSLHKDKLEFLIVSPFGTTLYEVMKKVTNGPLSMDCAISVGLQMLKALKDLHGFGYIHRNIRPSAFHIGLGPKEATVYLHDFREVRKFEENKIHLPPRDKVKMFGSLRFASRACQNLKDQGRKDDLECWLYTLFFLMDPGSLPWKQEKNKETVLAQKEAFMNREGKDQFTKAPEALKPLLFTVYNMVYDSIPDHDSFKTCLETIQVSMNLNKAACDWAGKPGLEEIVGDTNRSLDCKVTGERDAMVRGGGKHKKPKRNKLNPGDLILAQGATCGWKIVHLLGSGGFGDVYQVHRANEPPANCYALKTESEEGEKRYLRLKIEVTVMMKIAEQKKKRPNAFKNFIEFVDRGKCEELKCKFVVMGLVGPSLEDVRRKYILADFSKHTAFYASIETVTSLRDLHSIGYLHRDIKPANFAIGLGQHQRSIFMLDFGIAKLFVDEKGVHKVKRARVKFLGTLRFACRASMMQQEQGRKDDLETWIYMVIDFFGGDAMKWRGEADPKEILKLKKEFFANYRSVVEGNKTLTPFSPLVAYVDKMEYETTPDYDYILNFLKTCAKDLGAKISKKVDWHGKDKCEEFDDSEKSEKKGASGDDDE